MGASIGNIARWIFGLASLFNATVMAWELFTRPDRDVWVEQLGSVVSLQSIYLGGVVVSVVVLIACAFPVLRRWWEIPRRRQERERERQSKRQKEVIHTITQLKELLRNAIFQSIYSSPNENTSILLLKEILINQGVAPNTYRDASDRTWKIRLDDILPYIIQHGIEHGAARYEADADRQEEDENGD